MNPRDYYISFRQIVVKAIGYNSQWYVSLVVDIVPLVSHAGIIGDGTEMLSFHVGAEMVEVVVVLVACGGLTGGRNHIGLVINGRVLGVWKETEWQVIGYPGLRWNNSDRCHAGRAHRNTATISSCGVWWSRSRRLHSETYMKASFDNLTLRGLVVSARD